MQRLLLIVLLTFTVGCGAPQHQDNSTLLYGTTGLPKNCRAIIKFNIDGYREDRYTAAEVVASIDRNCGEFGYSWTQ
jgi:hypothetical protein